MDSKGYDAVIVGSGVSGMAAAIMLAKEGERVLVLEQHRIPGGLTQTYTRENAVFPTGVHRIGSLEPGQPLWFYFSYLGLMEKLELVKLSDTCFERLYFPGTDYSIPTGHERCREYLTECFPDQKKKIHRYFSDMATVVKNISRYDPSMTPKKDLSLSYLYALDTYLDSIGITGRLKSVLTANSPLYALPSSRCPVLTHFIISDSYLNSSFRINETKTPFSRALEACLTENGGLVRTRSKVTQFLIKDRCAFGVKLDNDQEILAQKIIFSGHPSMILDLCPPELFRPVFRKKLARASNTPGMFGLALKWENRNCPLEENDGYLYDSWDVDRQYQRKNILGQDPLDMVYLSASADSSTGHTSVTALIGIGAEDAETLKTYYHTDTGAYKDAKMRIAQKMMDHICNIFPGAKTGAKMVDAYTPMTFERYTLTKDGSAYGIEKSAQAFLESMFSPATRIKNLFLTGQSIGFNGVHGAIVSSAGLCRMLFGDPYMTRKISGAGK